MILTIVDLPLAQIRLNETARQADGALIASLRQYGLQPVDVEDQVDGSFRLVKGSRRLAAARALAWSEISAIVAPAGATALSPD